MEIELKNTDSSYPSFIDITSYCEYFTLNIYVKAKRNETVTFDVNSFYNDTDLKIKLEDIKTCRESNILIENKSGDFYFLNLNKENKRLKRLLINEQRCMFSCVKKINLQAKIKQFVGEVNICKNDLKLKKKDQFVRLYYIYVPLKNKLSNNKLKVIKSNWINLEN